MKIEELTYHEGTDGMLYPDLEVSEKTNYPIGKYGNLRLTFLREHRRGTYTMLLTQNRLNGHLHRVETEAKEMRSRLMKEMAQSRGVNETMKENDQMRWVAEMNNIRASAEETVLAKLIYV